MLKKLTNYTQVKKGDLLHIINPITNGPDLVEVSKINLKERYFCYTDMPNRYVTGIVRENRLDEVVLLRKTKKDLDVLAGKNAYEKLTKQNQNLNQFHPESGPSKLPGVELNPSGDPDKPYDRPDGH